MELRDLIVTPIIIILIYLGAYLLRPYVTDSFTRRYFMPALSLKILGALSLGFIYQFYYGSGDTFMYHTYGSRIIWEAFRESPLTGLKLLFADGTNYRDIYEYANTIYFFRDQNSYAIIRLAAFFDLFTFSTYSATACLFAVLSFIGAWQFFKTFYLQYPHLHLQLAIAVFFIPSVFFWGSGILKDSVTLAFLGIATYQLYLIFILHKYKIWNVALLLLALYSIFSIKLFILQAFLPSVILWIGLKYIKRVPSLMLKIMVVPFIISVMMVTSYYTIVKVGEDNSRYSISKIAETARITAYDIRFYSGREAGSGYALEVDSWTPLGMLQSAPAAINVSLFRPYLWEVKNPLMLMASLESTFLFLLTAYVVTRNFRKLKGALGNHNIVFCLAFSISFAFAVGISTFNFGTLTRYRIPVLPFYLIFLIILSHYPRDEQGAKGIRNPT